MAPCVKHLLPKLVNGAWIPRCCVKAGCPNMSIYNPSGLQGTVGGGRALHKLVAQPT